MAALKPILLVEDNPNDIELTLAALESSQKGPCKALLKGPFKIRPLKGARLRGHI